MVEDGSIEPRVPVKNFLKMQIKNILKIQIKKDKIHSEYNWLIKLNSYKALENTLHLGYCPDLM